MRGKKTAPEVVYQVMTSYAITNNLSETARILNLPLTTVKDIIDGKKGTEEYEELRSQKQEEFCDKASAIIDMLLNRITDTVADEEKDIPLHHLTTAIGTLYDKRALSRGDLTQNVGFATNLDIGTLLDVAGYTKKDDNE